MKRKNYHVASKSEKEMALALTGGDEPMKRGRPPKAAPVPLRSPDAPSKSTLRRWRAEHREHGHALEPHEKGHPSPKLSEGEKRVLGGWVLDQHDLHHFVSNESLRSWVLGS